jgi:citrate lyase beta subunit
MRTFLFLAAQQPEATARLIRASGRAPATVVLDLEDTLWDVTDEARTSALKAGGRENIVTLAREHPELFERQPIGVRVNLAGGPEARLDFEALGAASRFVEFECVVVPKLETQDELAEALAAVRTHGVACRGIVPIVETRRAMANLGDLLPAIHGAGIEWVIYGHYDFALDSGWWPFPEHDDPAFWDRVEPLIARIEAAGLGYVHPPYLHIHDDAGLVRILERLERACGREFGVMTIGLQQSATVDRVRKGAGTPAAGPEPSAPEPKRPAEHPLALARRIVAVYPAARREGTGFALDPRTGEFISAHVYLAARNYLADHE